MTDLDSILINNFSKMTLSEINNKIKNTDDIDDLTELVNKLTISEEIPKECKNIIIYWAYNQYETINKNMFEKEKPPLINFY